MGKLDVAVKTIDREIVTPHLTHEEALRVIRRVRISLQAPVHKSSMQASCKLGTSFDVICTTSAALLCFSLEGPQAALHLPLQELKILEVLPLDRRVVQLYGHCTKGDNILLVLELMQVNVSWCNYSLSGHKSIVYLCMITNWSELLLLSMLHTVFRDM